MHCECGTEKVRDARGKRVCPRCEALRQPHQRRISAEARLQRGARSAQWIGLNRDKVTVPGEERVRAEHRQRVLRGRRRPSRWDASS